MPEKGEDLRWFTYNPDPDPPTADEPVASAQGSKGKGKKASAQRAVLCAKPDAAQRAGGCGAEDKEASSSAARPQDALCPQGLHKGLEQGLIFLHFYLYLKGESQINVACFLFSLKGGRGQHTGAVAGRARGSNWRRQNDGHWLPPAAAATAIQQIRRAPCQQQQRRRIQQLQGLAPFPTPRRFLHAFSPTPQAEPVGA